VGANYIVVPDADVKFEGAGNLTKYMDSDTESGHVLERNFCRTCGCPVRAYAKGLPGHTIIRLGIFDASPKPVFEPYTRSRQAWEAPVEGAVQFSGAITMG